MVQGSLSWIGQEYPLAVHQLRRGESVRGSPAPAGGSLADRCVNGGAGGLTAQTPIQTLSDQRSPRGWPVLIHPETDVFVQT